MEHKFEKMALYKNKKFLLKNVGLKEFKKQIIKLIPDIYPLITEKHKSINGITYYIDYHSYNESIVFSCSFFKSYEFKDEDIIFKRKNGTYKTKINFEPFINWYRYTFINELKEFIKENKNNYDPYLEHHISNILIKNRIDYINKIIYE
jgi:hypothetical protein